MIRENCKILQGFCIYFSNILKFLFNWKSCMEVMGPWSHGNYILASIVILICKKFAYKKGFIMCLILLLLISNIEANEILPY